jgi:hypothetical protein
MDTEPKKPTRRSRRKKPPVEVEALESAKLVEKAPVVEKVFPDETIAEMFGEPEPQPTPKPEEPVKEALKPWKRPVRPVKAKKTNPTNPRGQRTR